MGTYYDLDDLAYHFNVRITEKDKRIHKYIKFITVGASVFIVGNIIIFSYLFL